MTKKTKKKRGTRMTGTETRKPCVDCGKMKDRFKSFKPRWAGCLAHKGSNGRRVYTPGCEDCDAVVNGNIRQPRCIDCDAQRPKKKKKKKKKKAADPKPTKVEAAPEPEPVAAVNVDPNPTIPPAPAPEFAEAQPKVGDRIPSPEDGEDAESVVQAVVDVAPVADAVTVEAQDEPAPESVPVPEPKPKAEPKAARPAIASMADLSKLFDDEGVDSE